VNPRKGDHHDPSRSPPFRVDVPEEDLVDLRRRAFPSLIYFNEAEAGGHFPAWEVADVFATEVRAAHSRER
jgi:hypothetical protein